jgi:hypothetical protein
MQNFCQAKFNHQSVGWNEPVFMNGGISLFPLQDISQRRQGLEYSKEGAYSRLQTEDDGISTYLRNR